MGTLDHDTTAAIPRIGTTVGSEYVSYAHNYNARETSVLTSLKKITHVIKSMRSYPDVKATLLLTMEWLTTRRMIELGDKYGRKLTEPVAGAHH